ncbi:MAG: hypothetical protein ACI9P9_000556 [Patescibacteria group bacterium]|jgi:hypothetical protein
MGIFGIEISKTGITVTLTLLGLLFFSALFFLGSEPANEILKVPKSIENSTDEVTKSLIGNTIPTGAMILNEGKQKIKDEEDPYASMLIGTLYFIAFALFIYPMIFIIGKIITGFGKINGVWGNPFVQYQITGYNQFSGN